MKRYIIAVLSLSTFLSCSNSDQTERKVRYMADTDMYNPVGYEAYTESKIFEDGMSSRKPVEHTIPRGFVPYDIPNTNEGYALAKKTLKSPIKVNEINTEKGKGLFKIYCAICHGEKGDGMGVLVKNDKFLGVPSYSKSRLPDITEGSIFHVITYGKNMMGSHASQLNSVERWKIVQYVEKLRKELN